jgi:3-dehydroquinate synthase
MSRHTLRVALAERSYAIEIGPAIAGDAALYAPHVASRPVAIVTNDVVGPLHLAPLRAALLKSGARHVIEVVLPDGEEHKDWRTLDRIYEALLQARADRHSVLVALGGGVVGDMAGFAAATYQRGVAHIQVPTTLLAQVDSSVGGKTAINHPLGKNMVGAFHQPALVVADTAFLATLPEREYASGLAEVVKYGAIRDAGFLGWIEDHRQALRARDPAALSHAILRSCEIKAQVVAEDERETGARALLNFGHTFGHAIESAAGYGKWLHGEAVAAGMALAARYSARLGLLEPRAAERLIALLGQLGLPVEAPGFTPDTWLEYMGRDKKNEGGRVTLILLQSLGEARVARDSSADDLKRFLAAA